MRQATLITFYLLLCFGYSAIGQVILSETFETNVKIKTAPKQVIEKFENKNVLSLTENSTISYEEGSVKDPGAIRLKIYPQGLAKWTISAEISNNGDFSSDKNWRIKSSLVVNPGSTTFNSIEIKIDTIGHCFLRVRLVKEGEGKILVSEFSLETISEEAKKILITEADERKTAVKRKKEYDNWSKNQNLEDAKTLVSEQYLVTVKNRVKSLGMLIDKSSSIVIVAGTASSLASYNQLSNPYSYEKFDSLERVLTNQLDTLEKVNYQSTVGNKVNTFFDKFSIPLDILKGVANSFTGGGFGLILDGLTNTIAKRYSFERLKAEGIKRSTKIKLKQDEGIKMIKAHEEFLSSLEKINNKAIGHNSRIFSIYQSTLSFNNEVENLLLDYLNVLNIKYDNVQIRELVKNQDYSAMQNQVEKALSALVTEDNFNPAKLNQILRKYDDYFIEIDLRIKGYNAIANNLSSYYADFERDLNEPCSIKKLSADDRQKWTTTVTGSIKVLSEVSKKFRDSYVDVDFKKID